MKKIIIFVIALAPFLTSFEDLNAQTGAVSGTQFGQGQDSIRCLMNLSLYIEFYRHKNYADAIGPWRIVFNECPASRESMYAYGIEMYKDFIEKETDPNIIRAYADTIMMIHDQRIQYFGDEGNVLGRKAIDLLRYKRLDGIEYVQQGYDYLKRSIEIEEEGSSPVIITTFVTASVTLFMENQLGNNEVLKDYVIASDIIDAQLRRRSDSRTRTARETIDQNLKESGALSCDAIVSVFGPRFESTNPDQNLLQKLNDFLTIASCEGTKMYADVSVKLYEIEPTAQAAYNLARLFLRRDDHQTASKYYLEAIEKGTDDISKATYNYELALLNYQQFKNNTAAVNYAQEAARLNPNWGEPYILLGTIYLSGRNEFADSFEQQTVFWVAVDMFQRALSVDSSVTDRANSLIRDYSVYFPALEELFFRSIKEGDRYTVKGWINRTTTARARK